MTKKNWLITLNKPTNFFIMNKNNTTTANSKTIPASQINWNL